MINSLRSAKKAIRLRRSGASVIETASAMASDETLAKPDFLDAILLLDRIETRALSKGKSGLFERNSREPFKDEQQVTAKD